jgi:hypothetical protein
MWQCLRVARPDLALCALAACVWRHQRMCANPHSRPLLERPPSPDHQDLTLVDGLLEGPTRCSAAETALARRGLAASTRTTTIAPVNPRHAASASHPTCSHKHHSNMSTGWPSQKKNCGFGSPAGARNLTQHHGQGLMEHQGLVERGVRARIWPCMLRPCLAWIRTDRQRK